jgi:CheY-like chemotaxis protein
VFDGDVGKDLSTTQTDCHRGHRHFRVPASTTIDVAASRKTDAPAGHAETNFPASHNAQASEHWDAFIVRRRCLIVDDSPVYLTEARNLLQRQGMSVVGVASNSGDAIAIARSDRPDFALVDVDLGDESGFDVAHALAKSDEPVPVILISAYAEEDLRELLNGSPALGFLPKSVLSRAAIDDLLGDRDEDRGR